MEHSTRLRMVETGLRLLRRQGYAQTSWRELVKEAGTPWGSVHHFFPGGKEELAADALDLFARRFSAFFEPLCAEFALPSQRVRAWFERAAAEHQASGYTAGCPVAGVALNTVPMTSSLSKTCGEALSRWTDYLASKLVAGGIGQDAALELAEQVLITFEGALVVARIQQRPEGLIRAGARLAATLALAEAVDAAT